VFIFAIQNNFCDHNTIYKTTVLYMQPQCYIRDHSATSEVAIALCDGRKKLGYTTPDMKIMTRVIKLRRGSSKPVEKVL